MGRGLVWGVGLGLEFDTPTSDLTPGIGEEVVRRLCAMNEIKLNLTDREGRTALICAAEGCEKASIEVLLGMDGIDSKARNADDQTAAEIVAEITAGEGRVEFDDLVKRMEALPS